MTAPQPPTPAQPNRPGPPPKELWYENQRTVIGLLFIVFPVGIYGMWKGRHFTPIIRAGVTAFIVIGLAVAFNEDPEKQKAREAARPHLFSTQSAREAQPVPQAATQQPTPAASPAPYQPTPFKKSIAGIKDIPLFAAAKYSTETTPNGTAHRWDTPGDKCSYTISLLDVGNDGIPDRGVVTSRFLIEGNGILVAQLIPQMVLNHASGLKADPKTFGAWCMEAIKEAMVIKQVGDVQCGIMVKKTDEQHGSLVVTFNGGM